MNGPAERWRRVHHDVGKYIVRAASNVEPGARWPAALVPLLVEDLYGRGGAPAPRDRFADAGLSGPVAERVAADFVELAELEDAVRSGEAEAVEEAAAIARRIATVLRREAGLP